jgi:predicted nucleic acid-binding protein
VKLVVDASVAVKWVIRDPLVEANLNRASAVLRAIRARAVEVVEPPHWPAEVVSVIARARPHRVSLLLGILEALPFRVAANLVIYNRAAEIAIELNHHLFDTLYHAVALEEGATLVTVDDVYFRKARHIGAIEQLGEFMPPA